MIEMAEEIEVKATVRYFNITPSSVRYYKNKIKWLTGVNYRFLFEIIYAIITIINQSKNYEVGFGMARKYMVSRSNVMKTLYDLYIVNDTDIFNFKAGKDNPITYHHIIKVEDLEALGFPTTKTIANGLVLTRDSHSYLHLIEDYAPDIFYHINKIILLITKERRSITLEERSLLQILLEAYEYRMQEYNYVINPDYLKRVLVS